MKILLLGDVMAGENLFHLNRGILSKYRNKYDLIIDKEVRRELLTGSDLIVANMEYSLIPDDDDIRTKNPKDRVYRAYCDSLSVLKPSARLVFNIANNHFSQHGIESSQFTKKTLSEHGISWFGTKHDPLIIENVGKCIKLWGFSMIEDPNQCDEYSVLSIDKLPNMGEKKDHEIWIVSLHWGIEYSIYPCDRQIQYAKKLIDSGVDIIMGHHPHVVQPVQVYKGRLILYSLGNFLFDQNFYHKTKCGLVAKIDTSQISEPELFKTKQKKFKVNEIVNVGINGMDLEQLSSPKRVNHRFIARILMKLEFLLNILSVDTLVLKELLFRQKLKQRT